MKYPTSGQLKEITAGVIRASRMMQLCENKKTNREEAMTEQITTETIIKALRILAHDIQSDDGVANAAILQAAERLEEQAKEIEALKAKVELLEACREYDASGKNRPEGYIFTNYDVSQRLRGKS